MEPSRIRTKPAPDLELPEAFSRLQDIAYNLWWSWSAQAAALFARIDYTRWRRYRNPVQVLIGLDPERWETLAQDDGFTRLFHRVVGEFDEYLRPAEPTWFEGHSGEPVAPFAYFSTEYGWHECLHIYSGGLGVLSGDHCKSASDLGLPFLGVGLMYRHGYFRQTIDAEGMQQHFYPDYDLRRLPLLPVVDSSGHELHVPLELPGRRLQLRVWRALVGRVPVLLLDSDLPINHPADRPITSVLYVRGREMRLCQEIVLGVGGARVLATLGIVPSVWHMNEGHSALLALERVRDLVVAEKLDFEGALRRLRPNTIFTTHTPVPAGNEAFEDGLIRKYFSGWCEAAGASVDRLLALGRARPDAPDFNLTALALRTSGRCNAVSELHGRVAREMWRGLLEAESLPPVEHVTNGVHLQTWIGPEMGELLQRYMQRGWEQRVLEPGFAEGIERIPGFELWTAHCNQKRRLMALVRERVLDQYARHGRSPDELRHTEELLTPDALTVGFARRFATYKRADLVLRDIERLRRLVSSVDRPVQFLFAGKAHPADRPGQDLIRRICQAALDPQFQGRLVFLENYDLAIARGLVQGVDVWLNNPRRPQEASGTSGMKAAANGVLNCSILDGWWVEGYSSEHGWAIGTTEENPDHEAQDRQDADSLYRILSDEVVPCYYDRDENGLPPAWLRRMKLAMSALMPRFSTWRMVGEYAERYYLPSARGSL